MKKNPTFEESQEFLSKIFLRCPECGGKSVLYHVPTKLTYVLLKCKCTKWKLSFEICEL